MKKAKTSGRAKKKPALKDLAPKKPSKGGWATFPSSVKWEGPDFDSIKSTKP